jgi:hypothetical protein
LTKCLIRSATKGVDNALNGLSMLATINATVTILVPERRVLHHALTGLKASLKFWAIKGVIIVTMLEGFAVVVLADNFKPMPGMDTQEAYDTDIKVASLHRTLQSVLHRGPPEPLADRPWTVLAHAVLLAAWDCSRFVWRALVSGAKADEAAATVDTGSFGDVVIDWNLPCLSKAVPQMELTPVGPPVPRSPSTPSSCTGKGKI